MFSQNLASRNLGEYIQTLVTQVSHVKNRVDSILSLDGSTITVDNIHSTFIDVDNIALNNKINGVDVPSQGGVVNIIEDCKETTLISGGVVHHDAAFDSVNDYVFLTNELSSSAGQLEYNINPGTVWTANFEFQYVDTGGGSVGGAIFMYVYNTTSVSGIANLTQLNNLGGFAIVIEPDGTIRIRFAGTELTNASSPSLLNATWYTVNIVCEGGKNFYVYINNVNYLNFRVAGVVPITGVWTGFAAYLTASTDAEYRIRDIKICGGANYITNSLSTLGELSVMPISHITIGTLKADNFEENAAALSTRINSTGKLGVSSFLAGYGSGGSVIDGGGGTVDVTYIGSEVAMSATGSSNTAVGARAMYSLTSANFNTSLGASSLYSNTTGQHNIAIGEQTLFSNVTGENNVAVGNYALHNNIANGNNAFGKESLFLNTSGSDNCAYGSTSLHANTTGSNNTAVGNSALYSNTVGNFNNSIGVGSLYSNTSGSGNNAFGIQSMYSNTTGQECNAFGSFALYSNISGYGNHAFGNSALFSNTTGVVNYAFGNQSLYSNTTGSRNSAFGGQSLYSNTTGGSNNAFGNDALHNNTTGTPNNAFGYRALYSNVNGINNNAFGFESLYSNIEGHNSSAFGNYALHSNTFGTPNNAFGFESLYSNTVGLNNNAFGVQTLYSNINGSHNNSFGDYALSANTIGSNNNAFGYRSLLYNNTSNNNAFGTESLYNNTTGTPNNAFGYRALYSNITGSNNNAFGDKSLFNNVGLNNDAFGYQALYSNTTGNNNIAVGYLSGADSATGNNNTFIGGFTSVNVDGWTNSIALGCNTQIKSSNECVIGNGITVLRTTANNSCSLGSASVRWSEVFASNGIINTSDAAEKNILPTMNFGLKELLLLKPISYTWKNTETQSFKRTHYGFAAQDIGKLIEDGVIEDSGIYIKSQVDNGAYTYGLRLSELIAPLVKSVQELHARLTTVESKV